MSTSRFALACLAAAALTATACGRDAKGEEGGGGTGAMLTPAQRQRLHVEPVVSSTFRPAVEVTGTVAFDGDRSTQQLCPISGPVARVLVEPGVHVRTGQVLAQVASPDYASAISDYRKAEASAANLQRIADMNQKLFDNDALSKRDLEQSQTDAASARADEDAALEQLRSLGVDSTGIDAIRNHRAPSGLGEIRAPIEGTVVEKLIAPGQFLQAGATPCFTIASLGTVWVMANVFEGDIPYVAEGDSVDVRATDDTRRIYRGKVTYVGALVDPNTRATSVRVVTANRGEELRRDMYVRAVIHSRRQKTGILLPGSAVLRDADNLPFVYLATGDSSYSRKLVTVGNHVGDRIEVTGGLAVGDKVIADGGLFLQFAESQ